MLVSTKRAFDAAAEAAAALALLIAALEPMDQMSFVAANRGISA